MMMQFQNSVYNYFFYLLYLYKEVQGYKKYKEGL